MPIVVMVVTRVLKKKVWKCLQEKKVVEIGILIPETLTELKAEVVKVVVIGLKVPATLPQVMLEVADVGKVLPDNLPLLI